MPSLLIGEEQIPQLLARGTWYALLDACDEPVVPPWAAAHGERAVCLYDGATADDYWDTAPYLLQLDNELYERIRSGLKGRFWGWLFEAPVDLAAAKWHWKRFVRVRDEQGSEFFFRFYDPRVVRTFLGAADISDQELFLGPVRSLLVVGDGAAPRLWMSAGASSTRQGGLVMKAAVLEDFSRVQLQRFVAVAMSQLRSEFCELLAPWSDEQLRQFVEGGIGRVRGWGILREGHVLWALRLLVLHEELDPEPLSEPWHGIVTAAGVSPAGKLQELETQLRFSGGA